MLSTNITNLNKKLIFLKEVRDYPEVIRAWKRAYSFMEDKHGN